MTSPTRRLFDAHHLGPLWEWLQWGTSLPSTKLIGKPCLNHLVNNPHWLIIWKIKDAHRRRAVVCWHLTELLPLLLLLLLGKQPVRPPARLSARPFACHDGNVLWKVPQIYHFISTCKQPQHALNFFLVFVCHDTPAPAFTSWCTWVLVWWWHWMTGWWCARY